MDSKSDLSKETSSSRGSSGGSVRHGLSLRRLFRPGESSTTERERPTTARERPTMLPTRKYARPLVGGVPSAFMASLPMAAYVNTQLPSPNPEPRKHTSIEGSVKSSPIPDQSSPPGESVKSSLSSEGYFNLPTYSPVRGQSLAQSVDTEPSPMTGLVNPSEQRGDWSRVMGRNVLEKGRERAMSTADPTILGDSTSNGDYVLSFSTVEIDYINGHTMQAHTWRPGGVTFIRLTPSTQPLPPLPVPVSRLDSGTAEDFFHITIYLSTSTQKELLHIDSKTEYLALLNQIGKHYECDIIGENGDSRVGLGFSTKAWGEAETKLWTQTLENVEEDQDDEYVEMILSVDTPEKWAWVLGIARQGLKRRGFTSVETRGVGVEMWLINEEGDNYQLTPSVSV